MRLSEVARVARWSIAHIKMGWGDCLDNYRRWHFLLFKTRGKGENYIRVSAFILWSNL